MSLLSETKSICKQHNITPNHERGQNFLINEEVYRRIIEIANLSKAETALEVGAGFGILTRLLCQKSGRVIAVEIDKKIFDYLKVVKEIEKLDNLELLNKNILDGAIAEYFPLSQGGIKGGFNSDVASEIPPAPLCERGEDNGFRNSEKREFKIVANLPYNITSIFLRKFLPFLAEQKIDEMVLMLQKEVAERIASGPGQMSMLSVSAQFYSEPQIVEYVDKNNFWPRPKVDSAIIKLKPISNLKDKKLRLEIDEKVFFQIARIGFSAKRKKLVNNLANGLHKNQSDILPFLRKIGLNSNARAQELNVEQWVNLANIIKDSV